ncbi:12896_t:CDS:2 [Cetraspora pellucida]|uniref:12896_t:CDS:1 n=1 Tax=Cetraspora pellucida TaxID=1433469 RepID=A0ACA9LIE4_9GLOM|nr:12896_t:CDS:2 [Cetraspora pellucida]
MQLQIEICRNDLRPTIVKNSPQCYVNLMKECWEKESKNHPSAIKICKILTEWQGNKNILSELTKSDEILNNIKSTAYPDDIYKSKFIEYTTDSELNESSIKE